MKRISQESIYKKEETPAFARKSRRPSLHKKNVSSVPERGTPRRRSSHSHHRSHKKNNRAWLVVISVLVVVGVVYALFLGRTLIRSHDSQGKAKQADAATGSVAETIESAAKVFTVEDSRRQEIRSLINDNTDVNSKLIRADKLLEQGDADRAVGVLQAALRLHPHHLALNYAYARALCAEREYDLALKHFLFVLQVKPDDVQARVDLAEMLLDVQEYELASDVADWAIDEDEYLLQAQKVAALAKINSDNNADAALHLRKILMIDSGNVFAQSTLGDVYRRQGVHDKSIQMFTGLIDAGVTDSAVYYNLAVSYAALRDAVHALGVLNKAANQFGNSFVSSWINSRDFDGIRLNPAFQDFVNQL
ncbi:MAG: tetratricopeptide repeat protein [Spartobacteria bacterium]|nr:tetratricopeptide repeat protein [Spartobacteria bacterium]